MDVSSRPYYGKLDDAKIYNHVLSATEIKELSRAKILHYTFNDPTEEPTTNIYPAAYTALAFANAYNGTGYGFGVNTNLQQVFDNTIGTFRTNITKVSRINSAVSQRDYVYIEIPSPVGSTRIVSF